MKKLVLLLAAAMLIAGCTSEFYKHDSVFKTNDHVAYSWWGYNKTTACGCQEVRRSGLVGQGDSLHPGQVSSAAHQSQFNPNNCKMAGWNPSCHLFSGAAPGPCGALTGW